MDKDVKQPLRKLNREEYANLHIRVEEAKQESYDLQIANLKLNNP